MRKVLIVAYRFPPQGGGGVQRTAKFAKYLPQHGWLPVVLSVSNPHWPVRDESLLRELPPEVAVHRMPTFEFERFVGQEAIAGRGTSGGRSAAPDAAARRRPSGLRRLGKSAYEAVMSHVMVPDTQIAWVPGAFVKALRLVRAEKPSLLYSTSPPHSGQLLTLLLKRVTGLPWIADLRDPWTEGIRRKQAYARTPWRGRLEERLERAVFTGADHILLTTDQTLEEYVAKYSALPRDKFSAITNGFDPADFVLPPDGEPLLDRARFQMTLTGNLEVTLDATPFFTAIKEICAEDDRIRADLRVNFIGTKRGKYDDFIRDNGLSETVRYVDYVPHQTSVRYLAESDALFLCQVPVRESAAKLPGKLFEYLNIGKPILALTLPGASTEILQRSGLGTVVRPDDLPGIKRAIRDLHRAWYQGHGNPAPDQAYIATFDRSRQAERLAALADRVAAGKGGPR